ncbi:MAG: polyphenol oxidase family protein [Muribaculaceae bacterium]|nr:polyphenol oxidase family protein [Muribaculaceae bacterium]
MKKDARHSWIDLPFSGVECSVEPVCDDAAGIAVIPRQTHTCNVAVVHDGSDGTRKLFADTDALVTTVPGLAIGVRTADCVPVLIFAPDVPAVAAVHAGWKGSLGGIVDNAVKELSALGASPALMKAAMGPCICGECYEVSPDLAALFTEAGFGGCVTHPSTGTNPHLDLPEVNRQRLLRLGVPDSGIAMPSACTKETGALPSWRRQPGITDRLLTWIRLTTD